MCKHQSNPTPPYLLGYRLTSPHLQRETICFSAMEWNHYCLDALGISWVAELVLSVLKSETFSVLYVPYSENRCVLMRKAFPPHMTCGHPRLTAHNGRHKKTYSSEEEECRKGSWESKHEQTGEKKGREREWGDVLASFLHCLSTDDNPQHSLCPKIAGVSTKMPRQSTKSPLAIRQWRCTLFYHQSWDKKSGVNIIN